MNNLKLQRYLSVIVYLAALPAVIPVFPFLVSWVQILLVVAFAVGIGQEMIRKIPGLSLAATLICLGAALLFVMQISFNHVIEPIIHILCVLLGARLVTAKTPRNVLQLFALATIILAASSLLTLDIAYLFYLAGLILIQCIGLILLTCITEDAQMSLTRAEFSGLKRFFRLIPAGSFLMMAALFLVLPRTPVPLWNIMGQEGVAAIGMSDQVRPGSFSDLAGSGQVAFRAEMEQVEQSQLYWRGIVMAELDGSVWRRGPERSREMPISSDSAQEIPYSIFAEPKTDSYLVTLDRTSVLQGVSHRSFADGVFVRNAQDRKRITYHGIGQLAPRVRHDGDRSAYLMVPESLSSRLLEVADAIAADAASFAKKITALEGFFVQQQLSYSTRDLPVTDTPLETFLFTERRGYCEHFASSFAVLLRLLGVPTRLVGGYYGGDYNRFGNFYLISEDQAHVWVEALDDEGYWRRIDPSRLAVNAEQAWMARGGQQHALQHLADALFYYWTRHVLNFDLRQQFELVRTTTGWLQNLTDMSPRRLQPLPAAAVLLSLLALVLLVWRHRRKDVRQRLIRTYLRRVARCAGCRELPPALGLYQLARLTKEPLCQQFVEIYGAAIYADKVLTADEYRQLRQIIRQLKGKPLRVAREGCIPPIPQR